MDTSWMYTAPRASKQYTNGVEYFLDFAFEKSSQSETILCPCIDCQSLLFVKRAVVYDHLICSGFKRGYLNWKDHEEVHEEAPLGGVEAFDACVKENFKLKAAVLSTISDFPGYANLSRWSNKGEYACPVCAYDKTSKWLDHGRKWCYMGHQRWLEHDHCWRKDIRSFDGNKDLRHAPIPHAGDDVLNEIENIDLNNENDFRGYANLSGWSTKGEYACPIKFIGMKSYDCHMSMQEYLPIALRGTLPDHVSTVLIELCDFFRDLCTLKSYVNNKACPEGSIAEGNTKISLKENIGHVGYLSLSLKRFIASNLVNGLESGNTQEVLSYYGSLKEVVKLNYSGKIRMVLFKCDWVDVNKGCKRDKFGITLVNFSHLTHSGSDIHDDPFVFASQVDKVFYAKDPQLEGWLVVRHVKVKDAFNMGCNSDQNNLYSILDTCDVPSLHRNEVDGDDEIDVTESTEDKEDEEEEEDTYQLKFIKLTYKSFNNKLNRMGKRIHIVSTKEVVQPAESTNQGQNILSDASDPSVDKYILQGAKKRVRGPTKKKEIWNLASDEKVLVTFNELCQPIEDEGNELTNFLRTLVRMPQHIGIHYP
nr:hypothetical protein CTI12_AA180240 [Tanacetum cinerariifolium]